MVIAFCSEIAGYSLTDNKDVKTQFDQLIDITESELLDVVCELPTLCTCSCKSYTVFESASSRTRFSPSLYEISMED